MERNNMSKTELMSSNPAGKIEDWEFTLKAIQKMNYAATARDFDLKDADIIYHCLIEELQKISVADYLKRYIYEKAEFEENFYEVPESEYRDIILDSFRESGTPFSRKPLKRRDTAVVNDWLSHQTMQRETVLLLGFGLQMSDEDVNTFLKKSLGEAGLNHNDPWEFICYFCFYTGENYHKALELMDYYEKLDSEKILFQAEDMRLFKNIKNKPEIYIFKEDLVRDYLRYLKKYDVKNVYQEKMYQYFLEMYDRVRIIISEDMRYLSEKNKKYMHAKQVSKGDVEQSIYSGIPITQTGNLSRMSKSTLGQLFDSRRLTRQRIDALLKGKILVDRMDLLTLQFYIYGKTVEPDWPAERYLSFIRDTNQILTECGLIDLYPANPYEAFLLMCLNAEDSLATFSEIWEMSYQIN